ncbi:MAG TPA: DUF1015 family protein [Vicinamibacterales bacterium]|nr:DUF1015 family protein [Vicinamibacterales bacterium]
MATLNPFRAVRPRPDVAARIAAVPYDVVSTEEARGLAFGEPLSFLHVSRAEIDLPAATDPHSEAVYGRAAQNYDALKKSSLVVEAQPAVYAYRLAMGRHVQTGIGAAWSLDEYANDVIKKHERTRRDKEDDRTKHMIALGAQTGPVFLTYRAAGDVSRVVAGETAAPPLFDFDARDGVRHTVWRISPSGCEALVAAFKKIPALYIADGHHRAASAARAREALSDGRGSTMLGVAFPHDQVQILPYNRIVRDLGALTPEAFMAAVRQRFGVAPGPAAPDRKGDIAMFFAGAWQTLRPRVAPDASNPIASLDVSVLQDQLLAPILGIADVRTDRRIDFVGGARGTSELERLVSSGNAAAAFSLYPVGVADLMTVSDAGDIMPPKSTWFEPKLRDGLLINPL